MNALTIRDTRFSVTDLLCALGGFTLLISGIVCILIDFGHPRFIGCLTLFGGLCGLLTFAFDKYKRCHSRRQIIGFALLYPIIGALIAIFILLAILAGIAMWQE